MKKCSYMISLLFFLISLPLLNGCATFILWNHDEGVKVVKKTRAEADQIYLSYDKEKRGTDWKLTPKYCIPYQIRESDESEESEADFPEKKKGCLIFQEKGY